MHTIRPRLTVARPGDSPRRRPAPPPVLSPLARHDVEQAREFLMNLGAAVADGSPAMAMLCLARCAEHSFALLHIIDAEMPR